MDRDECREIEDQAKRLIWVRKYIEARKVNLCQWVSTFHPNRLPCHTAESDAIYDRRGSYNIVCKIKFDATGETWAVRFPQGGGVGNPIADEKFEAEVATINKIRQHTDIPLPAIKAWGLSCDNRLGLGPFIISAWVDGINLTDVLASDRGSSLGRLIHENTPDTTIECLWRQIARFMLQLSQIDFDYVGSCTTTPRRPLSIKAHQILESGVEIPWALDTTFTSAIDYFNNIADHDLRQLHVQPNSVDDEQDARQKYINWNVLRQLVPRFVHSDNGPFKLICDDFGPMNMLVNNTEDLQIVAVIDWEWCYAGPRELFWSPPLWLLGQHPACWEDGDDNPLLARYHRNLEILIDIMKEEETKFLGDRGCDAPLPSVLLRRHQQDGSMWFYHIIHQSYNGPTSIPFSQLRASTPDFSELAAAVPKEDIEAFVQLKLRQLKKYEKDLAEMKSRNPSYA